MKRSIIAIAAVLLFNTMAIAQYESPVTYMSYLTGIEENLNRDYMSYMSAMAHLSPKKAERKRVEVLSTIATGAKKVHDLKAYNGETDLRDAYARYLSILHALLNDDYAKIVNMEEIAEQSYDAMEAYLTAQDQASEKLRIASDSLESAYKKFAGINQVNLVEAEKNKTSRDLEQTAKTMGYYNQVFLVYFKPTKQEGYLAQASNEGNVNGVEQNRSTLAKYSNEGLQTLSKTPAFENDHSLVTACRKLLEFQKDEAEIKYPNLITYMVKRAEFEKYKKTYDTKAADQRTAADVDGYNKLVGEMNSSVNNYNKINQNLNELRVRLRNEWGDAVNKFLDNHIPNGK